MPFLQKIERSVHQFYISLLPTIVLNDVPQSLETLITSEYFPKWFVEELMLWKYDKKDYEGKKLYLISFEESLSITQALQKIRQFGLIQANFIETAIFATKKRKVKSLFPINIPRCYSNPNNLIGDIPLSVHFDMSGELVSPGEAEWGVFTSGVNFLVKEIDIKNEVMNLEENLKYLLQKTHS